ncbi:MAG: hypothetical protein JNK15_06710 [Planctomycetes bacterium]|nr:hypothetical protein [Planctomycetota bacterium]
MAAPRHDFATPRLPSLPRFLVVGVLLAAIAYAWAALPGPAPGPTQIPPKAPPKVAVPELDRALLATARDDERSQRLQIEEAPVRHLLAKALDVGPATAHALGMPDRPSDVRAVRADLAAHKGRWLWFVGELEDLSGPRSGHPVLGQSIFEATLRLADGERVLFCCTEPPAADVTPGTFVRAEGFLLKLVDRTYPSTRKCEHAPFLVGRALQRDWPAWGPVQALSPELFAGLDDSTAWPGDLASRTLEADQTPATWQLAAFARDAAANWPAARWAAAPLLTNEEHDRLRSGKVERGAPFRIQGTVVQRTTLAAPANPAGITTWTAVWLQVREYGGGVVVPVWLPHRLPDLPERAAVEVHGLWYRWLVYESIQDERRRTPLFVAAALVPRGSVGNDSPHAAWVWLPIGATVSLLAVAWARRRRVRADLAHATALDERRRRRAAAANRTDHAGNP